MSSSFTQMAPYCTLSSPFLKHYVLRSIDTDTPSPDFSVCIAVRFCTNKTHFAELFYWRAFKWLLVFFSPLPNHGVLSVFGMCVWDYFLRYITASRKGRVLGEDHPSCRLDRGVPFPEVLVTSRLHQQFERAVLPLPSLCSVRRDVCHSDVWPWYCVFKICIFPLTGGVSIFCVCLLLFNFFCQLLFCPLSPLRNFCPGWFVLFLLIGRNSSGIGRNDFIWVTSIFFQFVPRPLCCICTNFCCRARLFNFDTGTCISLFLYSLGFRYHQEPLCLHEVITEVCVLVVSYC